MTNLDSISKSRDITLLTKAHIIKAMIFLIVMYGCESWTIKKAESQRMDAFGLWCWRRLLRVLWLARRSNQSILKEINPDYSLEGIYWCWRRWPKYWSFSLGISPSNEYSGLISFRIDWFDLCAVQGTLKSLLQHHSPKASILQLSAFFMVPVSHPCITTGKIIALTRQTFVGK